jgi:hypothetical protein
MTVIHQDSTLLSAQLFFSQITPSKVLDILQIFKLRKSSGLDSISHQMNVGLLVMYFQMTYPVFDQ